MKTSFLSCLFFILLCFVSCPSNIQNDYIYDIQPTILSEYIYPRGEQKIVAENTLTYSVKALLSNNSEINIDKFSFSASKGSFLGNTYSAPKYACTDIITVSYNGETLTTSVQVLDKNYMKLPFTYNGVEYLGMNNDGTGEITQIDGITLDYPKVTTFSADGFFTIQGEISNPECYDYAYLNVYLKSDRNSFSSYI